MKKNTPNQFVDVSLVLRATGGDAVGLTPTVRVKQDGAAWTTGAGVLKEGEHGSYQYEPTQAETNCDHLAVKFTEATVITQLLNIYPVDVSQYQADLSSVIQIGKTYRHTNIDSQANYDDVSLAEVP